MNKTATVASVLAACSLVASAAVLPAFAAGNALTVNSIGQRSDDLSTFGFSVCNADWQTQTSAVPVTVEANGVSVVSQSAAPIEPGACAYTYLPYSQFGMVGGRTYGVQISLAGAGTQSYSVTVPGEVLGASTASPTQLALMEQELALLEQLLALLQQIR
ncbi:MAG TPA: hypothetical protein VMT99_00050 [Candidatus Paceibacterota bacterium]|nr:hypothetical protein [Candidatus Paceibacterota bacterium]